MSEGEKKMSFVERMKQRALEQEKFGGKMEDTAAEMKAQDCPNCGAGRAKHDGVTHCAYCGFEFINTTIGKGVYLSEKDNSKK